MCVYVFYINNTLWNRNTQHPAIFLAFGPFFCIIPCSTFLLQILHNPSMWYDVSDSIGFHFVCIMWFRSALPPSESSWMLRSLGSLRPSFSSVCGWRPHLSMGIVSASCRRSKPATCRAAWRRQPLPLCSSRPSRSHTYLGTQEKERK